MKDISLKTWLVTAGLTILLTICCCFIFKIVNAKTFIDVVACLASSFFASGFLVLCFGLLTWCTNQGAFTGLSFGFRQIFEKRRFKKAFEERERYGEYRSRKLEKQRKFIHMIVVGGGFVFIAIIFQILYEIFA